jgi:hypothetical protein
MHNHQNSKPGGRTLADGLAQLSQEANGLFRVEIILPQDHAAIAFSVLTGDRAAWTRVNVILDSQNFIKAMARREPVICLTCPHPIYDPDATLALLVAAHDNASIGICSAICSRCSTGSASQVLKRAAGAFQRTWPGLRCVEITHPRGGHA